MATLARTADRLYWGARYIERAEDTARIVRAYHDLVVDYPSEHMLRWEPLAAGAQIRTLHAEDPFLLRVQLEPGTALPTYHHAVDAFYFVFAGSLEITGEGALATEESRWIPAQQPTAGCVAGADGADLIVVGMGGLPNFEWS